MGLLDRILSRAPDPSVFRCPITGQHVRQTFMVGTSDITNSDISGAYVSASCGHEHRLDSPRGQSDWTVDGPE